MHRVFHIDQYSIPKHKCSIDMVYSDVLRSYPSYSVLGHQKKKPLANKHKAIESNPLAVYVLIHTTHSQVKSIRFHLATY